MRWSVHRQLIIPVALTAPSQSSPAAVRRRRADDINDLPYRSGFFPLGPIFAFILCLIITLGQNYEAFLKDTIDWGGVAATYIGIPLFLIIWFGYKLIKGTHFVRYSEMKFPQNDKK